MSMYPQIIPQARGSALLHLKIHLLEKILNFTILQLVYAYHLNRWLEDKFTED